MSRTVIHYIDTVEFGGTERALLHLLGGLDRDRWRPVLFHPDETGLRPLLDGARAANVETRIVPRMRGRRSAPSIPSFRRLVEAENPAVFHAHLNWPLACTAGILAAAWSRVPAIVATVQLFSELPRAATIPLQRRMVTRVVGRYIAVSSSIARAIEQRMAVPAGRIEVIHNAIPFDVFPPPDPRLRAQMAAGSGRPVALTLARLHSQKGLGILLKAAAQLPDVAFAIAGDGPERPALEAEARRLDVADRVVFLGFRQDTAALLASADLFVLPSLNEGLPLSLLEALAAGRPVIASSIDGVAEIVTDGETGLLVPPGDGAALARGIRSLLQDPVLASRLAADGRARVHQGFSADRMAEAVMRTYESMLGTTHPRSVATPQVADAGVAFGDLRRTTPISRAFGFDRGSPVDRHYIEAFLAQHARDIRGRVLEVKDDAYTRRFGGSQVLTADVLDIDAANTRATFIDDLTIGAHLPADFFDCVVLTQTLHLIFDVRAAVETLHRILKPGGVVLLTVPGITQIPRAEAESWYWSFSARAVQRLLGEFFPADYVEIRSHGNVLAATAFLYGLAAHELRVEELDAADTDYPVTIAVRAVKSGGGV